MYLKRPTYYHPCTFPRLARVVVSLVGMMAAISRPSFVSPTEKDIVSEFSETSSNPELVSRCLRICNDYRLSAGELQVQWDLLLMNKGKRRMSLEALSDLDSQVREDALSNAAKRQKGSRDLTRQQFASRATSGGTFTKDTARLLEGLGPNIGSITPTSRRASMLSPHTYSQATAQTSDASPSNAFANRPDAGKLICAHNVSVGVASSGKQLEIEEVGAQSPATMAGSLMWERLDERARLLDSQLGALESALAARDDLPAVVPVVATSGEEVTVVGRVCCEGEGKLNLQSIFLEGSRASSNACRVRLDLSGCPEYALFPGQLIGVVGINSVGHTFVARRVLPVVPPAPDATAARSAVASPSAPPVTLLAAAGPFTTSDDLTYSPLHALLAKVTEERPDALVLVGPFVDEQHPSIAGADVPVSFDDLFERQVVAPLAELIESQLEKDDGKVTHVVMVPSTRDIHHQPSYPQPPLLLPTILHGQRFPEHVEPYIHVHTNPSSFRVGPVTVAACSVDALMLLGQQELAKSVPPPPGGSKPDRMTRLASHLLQQRQFVPLFPAPYDERAPVPVDVVANLRAGGLQMLPDVLLTPSDLAPFAKLGFGGVLCLNPGRLTRKAAGGNYATICIHPPPTVAEEPADADASSESQAGTSGQEADAPDALLSEAMAVASAKPSAFANEGGASAVSDSGVESNEVSALRTARDALGTNPTPNTKPPTPSQNPAISQPIPGAACAVAAPGGCSIGARIASICRGQAHLTAHVDIRVRPPRLSAEDPAVTAH